MGLKQPSASWFRTRLSKVLWYWPKSWGLTFFVRFGMTWECEKHSYSFWDLMGMTCARNSLDRRHQQYIVQDPKLQGWIMCIYIYGGWSKHSCRCVIRNDLAPALALPCALQGFYCVPLHRLKYVFKKWLPQKVAQFKGVFTDPVRFATQTF